MTKPTPSSGDGKKCAGCLPIPEWAAGELAVIPGCPVHDTKGSRGNGELDRMWALVVRVSQGAILPDEAKKEYADILHAAHERGRREGVKEFSSYLLARTHTHISQPEPFIPAGYIHAWNKGIRVDFGQDPYEAIRKAEADQREEGSEQ